MKACKCGTCQAVLVTLDDCSAYLHGQHLGELVCLRQTINGLEVSLRCRHCKRVTVVTLALEISPAVAAEA